MILCSTFTTECCVFINIFVVEILLSLNFLLFSLKISRVPYSVSHLCSQLSFIITLRLTKNRMPSLHFSKIIKRIFCCWNSHWSLYCLLIRGGGRRLLILDFLKLPLRLLKFIEKRFFGVFKEIEQGFLEGVTLSKDLIWLYHVPEVRVRQVDLGRRLWSFWFASKMAYFETGHAFHKGMGLDFSWRHLWVETHEFVMSSLADRAFDLLNNVLNFLLRRGPTDLVLNFERLILFNFWTPAVSVVIINLNLLILFIIPRVSNTKIINSLSLVFLEIIFDLFVDIFSWARATWWKLHYLQPILLSLKAGLLLLTCPVGSGKAIFAGLMWTCYILRVIVGHADFAGWESLIDILRIIVKVPWFGLLLLSSLFLLFVAELLFKGFPLLSHVLVVLSSQKNVVKKYIIYNFSIMYVHKMVWSPEFTLPKTIVHLWS